MVINRPCNKEKHVKFVYYTGKYPNLCSGILALKIDNKVVTFGDRWSEDYSRFWQSGGAIHFNDYCVSTEEWLIDYQELPEKYKKYADEIDQVFNENVKFGCCGGCL